MKLFYSLPWRLWFPLLLVSCLAPSALAGGIETQSRCQSCEPDHGPLSYTWDEWLPHEEGWFLRSDTPGVMLPEEGDQTWYPWGNYLYNFPDYPGFPTLITVVSVEIDPQDTNRYRVMTHWDVYEYPDYLFSPKGGLLTPEELLRLAEQGSSCSFTDSAAKAASSEAGHTTVSPPGLGSLPAGGCSTCPDASDSTQFKLAISLGSGAGGVPELTGSPAGQIVFTGDLAQGEMLKLSNFAAVNGAGRIEGTLGVGTVTARDVTTNDATASATMQTTFENGLLKRVGITVTPEGAGGVTTHVFERVAADDAGLSGVKYTRSAGSETESVTFRNPGANAPADRSGTYRMVNVDGSVETWDIQPEMEAAPGVVPTFQWNAVTGRFSGERTEQHEYQPADASQPKVVTVRAYGKIGTEDKSQRVLLREEVSRVLGTATLSTEVTRYGYDERPWINVSTATPLGTTNERFGKRLWTLASDGAWTLEMAEEITTLATYWQWDENLEEDVEIEVLELVYGDVTEFTPWLDGPAQPANLDTQAAATAFFEGLMTEARENEFTIAGCRRTVTTPTLRRPWEAAWTEKRVAAIGDVTQGVEYEYDHVSSSLSLGGAMDDLGLTRRLERWNEAETLGTWSASSSGDANLSVSLDHTGMARISSTSRLTSGGTVNDSWQVAVNASGSSYPPNYTAVADFPLWTTTTYDDQGRVVTEDSKLRVGGADHTLQSISTAYTGETGSTRSLGTTVLSAHGQDVIANGVRTSTYTDAQGVTTITKTDDDTGELISETKQGVAASGDYLAQPDVTTSYAKSTNATTGETTQTVTQTDGTTTRTLSITITDAQGRTKSVTDQLSRVTSYLYEDHGRRVTETLPGGGTRITETYLDGQLKSVTGTAVMAEYHDYTVNDGTDADYEAGSITETVYFGTNNGAHWRKTTTNFLGQVLLEEEPSPAAAAGGVIATTHEYNAKGQRVRTSRTGTVDLCFEYDDFGRMVKQGYDVSGDGVLTVASSDVLTEVLTSYEQQDGAWVEKTVQRTHTQPNGELPLDVVTRRGLREDVSWQSTTATDGSVTVYTDWTSAAGHLHGTQVLRSADGVSIPVTVQTSVSYNGLPVAQSVPGAATPVIFGYDGFGQMTSQIHPVAGTSGWAYNNSTGQLETQTPAGSGAVTYTYYPATHANAGQVASVTANGQVTRYAYDAQGRQTHQWGTGAQPLKYVYDGLGRLHELHTYQGGSGWDSETLPAAFTSATAAVTTWDYREGTNALWKKTDAANRSVVYAYGADGMRSTKTNARNITTTYDYETVGDNKLPGRLTGLTYSDDTPDVDMTYKRSGELATVSDAAGLSTFTGSAPTRTVTVTGNGLMTGLLVRRTERGPDQPETVLAQVGGSTVVSNQHSWTDAGLLHEAWQGVRGSGLGGSGLRQTWNRNATTGRLESVTTTAFGSGATHGVSRGYTHGAGGRVEKIWYNAGAVGVANTSVQGFDYDHDTHGRREVVRPWLPDSTPAAAEQPPGWKYGYNERGEVEVADRFTAEDGPETGIVGHQRRSYVYDLMGNRDTATQGTAAAERRETGYSANILQQYNGLTHSRSVEITGQAVAGATVELTLDAGTPFTVDRSLPQHQTGDPHSFRYVHAVAGTEARWLHVQIQASAGGINLTRQGFVYVPPTNETITHDDDGNLTSDAQWEYTWDAENRMTSATQQALPVAAGVSTPPPARKKLTFAYDYRNRRIAKRVFQLEPSAASQTAAGSPEGSAANQTLNPETWKLVKDVRFVHDGYQMIAELDHTFATGTGLEGSRVNRTFLWGPDVSGTMSGAGGVGGLLSTTYQGVTYQVCSDANGNVTGLVPTSGPGAGTLVARFDYDPFGNRITNTGPDVELCPFGFSTKYTDSETGIVNYELRDYSPMLGRWLSRDIIEEDGGINLYGMILNDAVNRIDSLGCLPRNGTWDGEPGNSNFKPNSPELPVTPFISGIPDFKASAIYRVTIGCERDATRGQADANKAIQLLKQMGINFQKQGGEWHHFVRNGYLEMQYVPAKIHQGMRHIGPVSAQGGLVVNTQRIWLRNGGFGSISGVTSGRAQTVGNLFSVAAMFAENALAFSSNQLATKISDELKAARKKCAEEAARHAQPGCCVLYIHKRWSIPATTDYGPDGLIRVPPRGQLTDFQVTY